MTREELEMRKLVRESDVIDRTDGSELAKAFNHLWEKYVEQESILDKITEIVEPLRHLSIDEMSDIEWDILLVIDKYKSGSEEK